MEMNSFYGGLPGQDFQITYLFTSKYGATESLKSDLQRGWQSLIQVGSIVAISYGLPGDKESFEANKKKDIDVDKKSYNSTLWRKEYSETNEDSGNGLIYTIAEANGLKYRLIASMTGNTPTIRVHANNNLHANEVPKAEIANSSDVDNPLIEFSFPVEQLVQLGEVHLTGANGRVDVTLDESDIDHPKLNFWLPQSQKFEKVNVVLVDANTPGVPKVEILLEGEEGATELTPVLKFTLPKTPQFLAENITSEVLKANQEPKATPDVSDPNFPKIKFSLPRAQVMQEPETQEIAPDGHPHVTLDSSDVDKPKLQFQLPRGIKYYYGDLIGARQDTGFQITDQSFTNYGVGDYYIHAPTGYLYKVVGVDGTTVTFDFVACLQAPKPKVVGTPIDAFTEGVPSQPDVAQTADANGWTLDFKLPKTPDYTVNPDIEAAPSETAGVTVEKSDNNTLQFNFKIPRGSRLYAAAGAPSVIEGAKSGDFYIDTQEGDVYTYNGEIWSKAEGNLRGPTGKTLKVVADYKITIGSTIPDQEGALQNTLEDGIRYIKYKQGAEKVYSPEELFAITWVDDHGDETAYWQYYIAGTPQETWGRVQLTGGTGSLLVDTYTVDANKTYNTIYLNTLITNNEDNKERTTYPKSKIEEMLSWGNLADLKE